MDKILELRSILANALFETIECEGVCIHSREDGTAQIVVVPKKEDK